MSTIDYNTLLKAELISLLEKRDAEITTLKEINTTANTDIAKQVAIIQGLQNELHTCHNTTTNGTVSDVIDTILNLTTPELQKFPQLIRTTDKGIEAYTAFTYGVLSCVGSSGGSNPDPNPDPNPDGCHDIEQPLPNEN
ncbi:hypothetical protein [Aquimarina sediminis]|uniref:hypothetical protein n=1 Tax=Aquimarina sediminis TaxID=2070536 RepID=UPI000CA07129|nr:hypothetical protein [Aquimarina sediminis]